MVYNCNKLYQETPNALGTPTAVFIDFFQKYPKHNSRVLDVGCGQGRDALMIAEHGHEVTGVDLSKAGIAAMLSDAVRKELKINGIVADIRDFKPIGQFDVVLIDRTLHMLPKSDMNTTLERLSEYVTDDGYLLIADEPSNIVEFKKHLVETRKNWQIEKHDRGYLFAKNL